MNVLSKIKVLAMSAILAAASCSITGCGRSNVGRINDSYVNSGYDDNRGFDDDYGYGNDDYGFNDDYGYDDDYGYGDDDYGYGDDDYGYGDDDYGYDDDSANADYPSHADVQPGSALIEWNGEEFFMGTAKYSVEGTTFSIKTLFDGKEINFMVYTDKVSAGDTLDMDDGDFNYDDKIAFCSLVDFATTNGTVYSGGTNIGTIYDLNCFKHLYLSVNELDPYGVSKFTGVIIVDMGDYGEQTFKVTAVVDANTSDSYGGGSTGGDNGGGDVDIFADDGICDYCNGDGRCHVCGGMRSIYVPSYTGGEGTYVNCSSCDGTNRCEWCDGTGRS